jgi:hypothetical protein
MGGIYYNVSSKMCKMWAKFSFLEQGAFQELVSRGFLGFIDKLRKPRASP